MKNPGPSVEVPGSLEESRTLEKEAQTTKRLEERRKKRLGVEKTVMSGLPSLLFLVFGSL